MAEIITRDFELTVIRYLCRTQGKNANKRSVQCNIQVQLAYSVVEDS